MSSDGSGSEWTPACQAVYLEQRRRIAEAQRTRGISANSAAVLHTFLDERRTNQQWKAERRREREAESRVDGRNEADKAEVPQRVHAGSMITRDLQQARVLGKHGYRTVYGDDTYAQSVPDGGTDGASGVDDPSRVGVEAEITEGSSRSARSGGAPPHRRPPSGRAAHGLKSKSKCRAFT